METLESWLDEHSGLGRREEPPVVRLHDLALAVSFCSDPDRRHGRTRGLYDPTAYTIFLMRPWDPTNAEDVSVLLHELVHHRQAPDDHPCPGAQEEAAYRLQDAWLRELGLQANVNWVAVVLEFGVRPARCASRLIGRCDPPRSGG